MVALTVTLAALVGALSFTFTLGPGAAADGLAYGLLGLAAPVIVSDLPVERLFIHDPLFNPRRLNIVSFVWCVGGGFIIVVSGILAGSYGNPSLLGRGIVLAVAWGAGIRLLTFGAFADRPIGAAAGVLLQPVLVAVAYLALLPEFMEATIASLAVAPVMMMMGPALLLFIITWRDLGAGDLRILPTFRAFVYSWAEEESGPLEEEIAKVSTMADLEVDELTFTGKDGGCLCRLVAPYIHPGPFRNVGSSAMSSLIREGLGDCPILVAHGVSSHEKDLVGRSDVDKVVEALRGDSSVPVSECSPMSRGEAGGAKATCQLFGKTALFTLTLAPKSHDDIPDSVMLKVREAAAAMGLQAIVVDAHNCLDELDLLDDVDADNLVKAAVIAMGEALTAKSEPFSVGFAEVQPTEWGPDDGMGVLGICVLTIRPASGPRYAYIGFDSNNMAQGLRERLLLRVGSLGYSGCEVLTSDTHVVNAIGATERGYHPIGEVTDREKVEEYVAQLLSEAKPLPASASFRRGRVEGVRIVGARGLEVLREVVKGSFRTFITTAVLAIPAAFIASAVAAFFL